jgi:hypothetical protein
MLDIAVTSLIARDLSARQFTAAAPRPARTPAAAPAVVEPRAPVRRSTVRALRTLADRLEPTGHYAGQS